MAPAAVYDKVNADNGYGGFFDLDARHMAENMAVVSLEPCTEAVEPV